MTTRLESTATLLAQVRQGDDQARERLCSIYLPILTRWAHGRLPTYARDLSETDDLVQSALLKALQHLDRFKPLHEGAFLAYLHKILLNNVRMEIRKHSQKVKKSQLENDAEVVDQQASILENTIGTEVLEKYERALMAVDEKSREAIILRVEFVFSYAEIAAALNAPSVNAARMTVSRALVKLAEQMK
jgi:RNA polymerase sigma factor (sigma-70 family)